VSPQSVLHNSNNYSQLSFNLNILDYYQKLSTYFLLLITYKLKAKFYSNVFTIYELFFTDEPEVRNSDIEHSMEHINLEVPIVRLGNYSL